MNRNHVPISCSFYVLLITICRTSKIRQMISIGKLYIRLCYKLEIDSFNINKGNTKGVFGRVDFKEDGKKKKGEKMRKEHLLEDVWMKGGGKSDGRVQAHQKLEPV